MDEFLRLSRADISNLLEQFLTEASPDFESVNQWGSDVVQRLHKAVLGGKMLRGSLVLLSAEMFGDSNRSQSLIAAAAIEMLHTGLLVHDDIMDNDMLRRGRPTMLAQYGEYGLQHQVDDSQHFGQSLAICVGDLSFFLAYQLLSRLEKVANAQRLQLLCSTELCRVGLAQMQDIAAAMIKKSMTEEEIVAIYRHKTAGYTFCLPLAMGATLANQSAEVLSTLDLFGQHLGLLFQIKDDQLGLFGNEAEVGKPVGSDISEAKQTLYYYYLFQKASQADAQRLRQLFGKQDVNASELDEVRHLIEAYGVDSIITELMSHLAQQATTELRSLPIHESYRGILAELINFNLQRRS